MAGIDIKKLPFGAAPVGDILQKRAKLFNDIPNVFVIGNDILIAGFVEIAGIVIKV